MNLFHAGEVEGTDQINYFCYNQCTYIPLTYIPIFINEINKILAGPRPKRCTPETTIRATIQSLNIPHYRYRPCLLYNHEGFLGPCRTLCRKLLSLPDQTHPGKPGCSHAEPLRK